MPAPTAVPTPQIDKAIKKFYEKESVVLKNTLTDGIQTGVFLEVNPADMAMFISTYLGVIPHGHVS